MPKLRKTSFDDSLVRNAVIKFFKENFNISLIHNPKHNKIDLLEINDSEFGVEVEHGKWVGNFWENDSYSYISGQKFRTVNIPGRKEKYWQDYVVKRKKTIFNPSSKKNLFVRTNKDFTQFIIIRPETISNPKKMIRTKFQPNNSNEVENWLSFKKRSVETYNLKNGKFILN